MKTTTDRRYGHNVPSGLLISAYWFAASFKWFILLNGLLASQVKDIVPGGTEGASWGMVLSLGAMEALIGPVVFGVWSDRFRSRFGRRMPFLVVGALLTVGALAVLANAQTLTMMVVGYILLQISDDIATAPYAALIPDLVSSEHRGNASGLMGFLQQTAQVLAGLTMIFLNPEGMYWAIAAVNLLGAVIVVATVRERPAPREKSAKLSLESWLAPWRLADFRWIWLTRCLNAIAMYSVVAYLQYYFDRHVKVYTLGGLTLKDSLQAQAALILVVSMVAAISAVLIGRSTDRFGRKAIIVYAGVAMFLVLIPFSLIPSYPVIFGLSVLFGVGYGAYISADWALAADIMPNAEDYARDMGMWAMSIPLGQMMAGNLGRIEPWLQEITGGNGYPTLFLFAACLFLTSTFLVRQVRGAK